MSTLLAQVAQPQRKCIKRHPCYYDDCPRCGVIKFKKAAFCRDCTIADNHAPLDISTYLIDGVHCRKVSLTKQRYSLVWSSDYELLNKWWWAAEKGARDTWYASANIPMKDGSIYHVGMHRFLLGLLPGEKSHSDHANHDGLDNRRSNLRDSTFTQNGANSRLYVNNTSGYRGVYLRPKSGRWAAAIHIDKQQVHLGFFDTAIEAAIARDAAALKEYGVFAQLNFPSTIEVG